MTVLVLSLHCALAIVAGMMSASETALLMVPIGRIRRLADPERDGSAALERLSETRHRLRATSAFTSGVAAASALAAGSLAGPALASSADVWSDGLRTAPEVAAAVLGAIILMVLTHSLVQALPRTIAVANPDRVIVLLAPFAESVTRLLYPLVSVLGAPWKGVVRVLGAEKGISAWAVSPEWHASDSDEGHAREEAEEALLEAVSDFSDKVVREVMVPRTDVRAVEDTATLDEVIEVIETFGLSRIPVYHETIDDIRGVLFAKDLLRSVVSGSPAPPAALAREPLFVPETKPIDALLKDMRSTTHIAVVADEYGGTAGIVTLEDLLEELVGEISDEYDEETPLVAELGGERYEVDARLPISDLNELLGTDFETDTDSVGGLYTEVAGRIPEQGESVVVDGVRLTVVRMEGNRLRLLDVAPVQGGTEEDDDA